MDVTDDQAIRRCKSALSKIPQRSLRDLLLDRMDMRTAVAALRQRQRGESPGGQTFGMGRWHRHIPAHWNDPLFSLENPMPWLKEADQLMQSEDPFGLERLLLSVSHKTLKPTLQSIVSISKR